PNPSFEETEIESARRLFAGPATFMLGAAFLEQVPATPLPEVAFAGRSNVGKSSLINALTGRKNLARTSVTPGRTQEINFFDLGGRLIMADLPGYGYAKAPKGKVDAWTDLIKLYLQGRPNLRRAMILVDSRHGLKETDREIFKLMDEAAVNYQVVLTKADKIKPGQLHARRDTVVAEISGHVAAHPNILTTSAVKDWGLAETRAALSELASSE
ncbi:MAG: ribosome biogenesis GTP-binding protein YihA/YsxC, partial [Rhodospirillaceae bacterium]